MSLLFESIRVASGKYENLVYHQQRMRRSLKELYGNTEPFNLEEYLHRIPAPTDGVYKCKLYYTDQTKSVEFKEYCAKRVSSLKIVEHDSIEYDYKYANREMIEHLFSLRNNCDDVLIVKKGFITDTSYANIAFKKYDKWFTPWQPLLQGSMRQQLLEHNQIQEEEISVGNIHKYSAARIFNAMLRFDSADIAIQNIVK
jgi:4-amino-4-deoxychorismate lyase